MLAKKIEPMSNQDKQIDSIMTYEQYRYLKNELDLNVRDKLIVELAWNLFSNEDLKNVKEEDVVFSIDEKTGLEVCYIALSNRTVKFEDPEIVRDIKKCLNTMYYRIETADCKSKTYQLKISHHLLKPVQTNKDKLEEYLIDPSRTLFNTIIQQNISIPGYNIDDITVDNIRKSKMIYLIANKDYFGSSYILGLFKKCEIDQKYMRIYEKMAQVKYGVTKRRKR